MHSYNHWQRHHMFKQINKGKAKQKEKPMKDTEKKYLEAVEKNLSSAEENKKKYAGLKFETAKMYIGIKRDDDVWDKAVRNIIAGEK